MIGPGDYRQSPLERQAQATEMIADALGLLRAGPPDHRDHYAATVFVLNRLAHLANRDHRGIDQ